MNSPKKRYRNALWGVALGILLFSLYPKNPALVAAIYMLGFGILDVLLNVWRRRQTAKWTTHTTSTPQLE